MSIPIYDTYKKSIDKRILKVLFTRWQRFKMWMTRDKPGRLIHFIDTEIKTNEITKKMARDSVEKAFKLIIPWVVPVERITITWEPLVDLGVLLNEWIKTMDIGQKMREIFG